jgi:hypothetical protein
MKKMLFLPFLVLLVSCSNEPVIAEQQNAKPAVDVERTEASETEESTYGIEPQENQTAFSARIIFTDSLGWGYQIFDGNTILINQVHIPSIQGNIGFKSRAAAQLTANFILYKLSNGIFPPTVDEKELDSLGVL